MGLYISSRLRDIVSKEEVIAEVQKHQKVAKSFSGSVYASLLPLIKITEWYKGWRSVVLVLTLQNKTKTKEIWGFYVSVDGTPRAPNIFQPEKKMRISAALGTTGLSVDGELLMEAKPANGNSYVTTFLPPSLKELRPDYSK